MSEKILMAALMAALVCHPSSSIKCFKPKPKPSSSQRENTSKSNSKKDVWTCSSLPITSVFSHCSNMNTTLTHPSPVPSTNSTDSCLVSKLCEKDPAFRVVETMFMSGWDGKAGPKIEKILKINHNVGVLKRFEEYREIVKSKSANISRRLAVDGNELLRFHGAIVTCSLGNNELSRICSRETCGVCRMVQLVGSTGEESVVLSNNSRRAHRRVTKECDVNNKIARRVTKEYGVNNKICARKAVVVCQVIAGRVARCCRQGLGLVEGREGGFDSVASLSKDPLEGSEELITLNARAMLPCFVILYNVTHKNILGRNLACLNLSFNSTLIF
ncbi:Ribonuclease P family protein, putative isoform 1 [Hibiscus syriacus]|uniref:Ribonuclease P family protein, putative isoform 1 n=1 Tax=Hibiscus syriacus TaxID=106335 RepID=A0A6A2YR96_HIBSY|nr:uncharacterized protein LOC120158133 [Hibiscus syriacus]KAE8681817.1 Ribonuclease P family protein, putative isoform 1 [Hibiscus syriacus]